MSYTSTQLNPPHHDAVKYANKQLNWVPSDTRQLYEQNCADPQIRDHVKKWEGLITYNFNSNGFRTPELKEAPGSVVALGCSFTSGIGLPIEDVWCSILGKKLQRPVYNLGVPGASADTAWRVADYWLPRIKPRYVVLLIPPLERFELDTLNGWRVFMHGTYGWSKTDEYIIKRMLGNDETLRINQKKNVLAIESIVTHCRGSFYSRDCNIWDGTDRAPQDKARDNMHHGPLWHQHIADLFYQQITTDPR